MKKLLLIFMFVLMFSSISALTLPKDVATDLKLTCLDTNNNFCDNLTTCQLTIQNPDMTNLLANSDMTYNVGYFNHSVTPTQLEEHQSIMTCQGSSSGATTFLIKVTGSGRNGISIEWVLVIAMIFSYILVIFGFYTKENPPITMGAFIMLMLGFYIFVNGFGALGAKSLLPQFIAAANFVVGAYLGIKSLEEI